MANISQMKREKMLDFLETLKEQHSDDDSLIAINQIEKELTSKKYGLVWEEHEEEVDVKMQTHIPVFTEVKGKEIIGDPDSDRYNFLLEGDNLHSLKLLEKTLKGKVDLIYIDPPYNTGGKDFIYNDKIVGREDTYRHSMWISFMEKRLKIARSLLSSKGAIFISIDDNENANLKLLCDEIFGEECFITDVAWRCSDNSNNNSLKFSEDYNHTLVYAKRSEWKPNFLNDPEKRKHFKNPDNDPKGPWFDGNPVNNPGLRPNLQFDITTPSGKTIKHPANGWRWSMETIEEKMKTGELRFSDDETRLIRRTYLRDMKGLPPSNLWTNLDKTSHNRRAKYELKSLFPDVPVTSLFSTPKPVGFIKYILELSTDSESIICDFFAGSGTTAHAVLALNKEDGGNRKFILCTNNENNICDNMTYPRCKTLATGVCPNGSEYCEKYPSNIKYFKTDFVDKLNDDLYDELLAHTKEMIEIQHGIKVDGKKYIMIMDDDEMDKFEKHFSDYSDLKAVYINQDVLLSTSQEKMLADVNTYIIPDCYFDFELREAGELW